MVNLSGLFSQCEMSEKKEVSNVSEKARASATFGIIRGVITAFLLLFLSQVLSAQNGPPSVVSTSPSKNALNVAKSSNLSVTFNTPMDAATLTNNTIKINGSQSGLHSYAIVYDIATKTATINPDVDFKTGEVVTVTLTRGIRNTNGDLLNKPFLWSFVVAASIGGGLFVETSTLSAGSYPHAITAAVFGRDGDIDLAVANYSSNTVSILRNDGSSSFTETSTVAVDRPCSLISADLDGDGDMDIAVASGSGSVSILKNDGSGSFTLTSTVAVNVGITSYALTSGDIDGDGDVDLVVADANRDTLSILLNDGNGSFRLDSILSVTSPYAITLTDIDGDGDLDIVVANSATNTVSILLNEGGGTYTQPSTVAVGNDPISIVALDLDGDSDIDLAAANTLSNTVSILKNNGSGTFSQSSTPTVANNPGALVAADLDGDGHIDLAVGQGSNTITVLKNNGNAEFTQSSMPAVVSFAQSIVAADLDGDGHVDLALANFSSNKVSILKNISAPTVPFTAFLHGAGPNANPAVLFLDSAAPTSSTSKYRDSTGIKFSGGNPWKLIGTWEAEPTFTSGTLSSLGDLHVWIGLKNSDDIGTRFDLAAEVWENDTLVAEGETLCITGVTRNPNLAKEVTVSFQPFLPVSFNGSSDVLNLRVFTRIGTNGSGGFCGGHSNAVGLRLYFDAVDRDAQFSGSFD